jgi:prophage regulatory protein
MTVPGANSADGMNTPPKDGFEPVAILDEPKVEELTSLSRTTRWRLERRGEFPKRVRLSPGRVGWRQADIEAWIRSRTA